MKKPLMIFPFLAATLFSCSSAPHYRNPASSDSPSLNWSLIEEDFQGDAWKTISPAQLHRYKDLYFMSDIHGQVVAFANLLHRAGLVSSAEVDSDGNPVGKWIGKQALLILAGDYIDGGDHSAQVLKWIADLHQQAGNDLIPLLGNHEAEFLADPEFKSLAKETRKSFGDETDVSATVTLLHGFKLGAVVGSWFVAHSGYIVPKSGDIKDWLADMSSNWAQGDKGFKNLSDSDGKGPAGVLERHDWWDKEHDDQHKTLNSLGLNGFIAGHEPKLFGKVENKILISSDKWAIKIDTGLKDEKKDSNSIGEILHCPVEASQDLSHCQRLTADGSEKSLVDN